MGHPTFPTCQQFPSRVAYFQIMEDTQAIDWDVEEEEETEQSSESLRCNVEPVGRLHIFSGAHGPEKDFPLHLGKNVVGRMPDCSVALPFPSISKQHAEIEILAWDKAPILRDCGSLNGTQILRPPKVLSPGVSHRLRDQELILFADLLCQYHRLDVSLPFVSRGPLTVEETPRVQGETQPQRLLLAEDSEEEVDFLSERRMVKKSRTTSSSVIVPESDEEGHSPVLGGLGPPFAFNLNSDTDVEEGQQPATEEASSAARRGATVEAKQSEAEVVTEIQLEKDQPLVKERDNDTKVKRGAGNGVVPAGVILERSQPPGEDSDTDVDDDSRPPGRPAEVHLERAQPFGFIDSDTDAEEERIPATPVVIPMKKRKIFHGVGTRGPGAPGLAHLQESQAGSDTDVEEGKAPQAVPLEKSQASMVINSDTDDEEEVSAALTLAHLKESQPAIWNRDAEEDMPQRVVLLQRSQTTTERDSDTDVEEEELPVENREAVLKDHTKIRALVRAHSEKDQPPFGDSDDSVEADKSSPGIHLERSQASTTVDINTQVEKEVPPGSAIIHIKKHQVSVEGTNQTDVKAVGGPAKLLVVSLEEAWPLHGDCETDAEEGTSLTASVVADVRKSQLPAEGDAGAEWAAAVLKQERAHEVGAQGGPPVAQVEQDLPISRENLTDLVVDTDTLGESTQPQREGAQVPTGREREQHVGGTKDSEDNYGDSEDLDLQATQCFLENQGLEVQSMEDEPTQAFMLTPPQELGPSHCSFQTTGLLNCKMPPAEKASRIRAAEKVSRGDQESPDACLPPTVPEAPAPPQKPLNSQSQKHLAPPPLLSPLLPSIKPTVRKTRQDGSQEAPEAPLSSELEPFHPKPKIRTRKSSRMTPFPATSAAPEPHPSTSTAQPVTPKPTSQATRSRTNRSSVKTPEPVVPTAPELQPSTSTDQPVTSEPTSQVTRGRKSRSSVKTPETVVPTALELQPSTSTDRPVTSEPTSQATRGRKNRSSVKTPEPVVPTAPELQPSTSTDQPVTSEPTYQATRGRKNRSSVKTPEPVVPTAPELRPSTSTDRPVTPKPTSRTTRSRTNMSSVKTPETVVPTAPELQISTSTDQPVTPKPTSRTTRSRTNMSSVKNPESTVPIAPELPPSTSTEQPVTPEPTSRATRGRKNRSSGKTPETLVPTAPKLEPSTSTDQPVTPEPTSQATRGRTNRSSVKTPETVVPTAPELQPSTSTDQPVTPEPTSQATRGRTDRSSVKTPETVVPTAPELQASASTDQPVTSEPTSRTTRGRKNRSSVKTPETVVPAAPELQPSTSTDQPVTPEPTSRATRGRTNRSSVKTPESIVPIAPELQPSTSRNQLVTPEPTSRATRCRTNRSSVKTPEPVVPTAPEPHPTTSTDQPVTPKLTSRATRRKTNRSSVKTPKPVEPAASDLEPFTPTDQSVTPEAIAQGGQSKTLRSSTVRAMPVPTTPEFQSPVTTDQPISPEPITQPSCIKRQRAAGNPGSLAAPIDHKPCSAPLEPKSQASRNQRWGAVRAAESLTAIPEPASPQLLETPIHASQIQKVEPAGRSRFTPELQPKASQSRKRSLATMDSPPHQKQPQRGEVSQKTVIIKEEEEDTAEKPGKEEDVVTPKPGKRKRDQAEEEPNRIPSRSLRRTKLNQESTAPKVLFTGVVDARGERAVLALGGSLAGSAAEASHLVTDRIRRTVKFLCALGRGIPILSLDWLHQSRKAGFFLPPDEYVVTDPEQEKNFGFSLQDALSRARERRLLEGYEIYVTPGVQPPPPQMGEIISCCGGTYLPSMPRSYKPQRVVITCPQDFPHCSIPLRVGLPLLSPEFLLTGVLKQEAKPEAFVLSPLEMSST
ncbi:mediator of DNA damage checkpoint protein 1 isoform X9 [Homo sapiens]|uniref:mediator of DNA damage checkpoint protein 1 isoform X9 n=2 Tax=Homo sapiens TaxID=9606 RepID=UPI0007DC4DD1|nr:mediator of DNA damage checkpoint protein 1 isoform X9 [Homo sapiens]XP_054184513.1 mediator of DNA damage checkpoint protein 1 isoform X9 [Homo sapiens]XP_054185919.1 mediator of DNA damage checkpoint protein 1 isoform X9 [Homo sapiens]XP_054186412.1 mediator of DNA damage checkpoint protein 1 isoform X9 [Homo sapiens]XP_054186906.1 mediator of DNA damage checkpoint protein 1 isoform X9 [Homo sapiens]XP_054212853.1 mediator of DNA damage checkpoint protein 1 isoform X9 [Homo sapiens]|eukprot:XP_016867011.1 mediator of DNA damage checkpoint protein 1 isoform X9 [Homo sapiens]